MSGPEKSVIDPVLMAVLNRRVEGVVAKMQNTLLRTARSGVINVARDFSCAVMTGDSRLLAAGESLPIHVMVGSDMMAASMCELHPELSPGDAFLHNSPLSRLLACCRSVDTGAGHRRRRVYIGSRCSPKPIRLTSATPCPTTYMATARDVYEEGSADFSRR